MYIPARGQRVLCLAGAGNEGRIVEAAGGEVTVCCPRATTVPDAPDGVGAARISRVAGQGIFWGYSQPRPSPRQGSQSRQRRTGVSKEVRARFGVVAFQQELSYGDAGKGSVRGSRGNLKLGRKNRHPARHGGGRCRLGNGRRRSEERKGREKTSMHCADRTHEAWRGGGDRGGKKSRQGKQSEPGGLFGRGGQDLLVWRWRLGAGEGRGPSGLLPPRPLADPPRPFARHLTGSRTRKTDAWAANLVAGYAPLGCS